MGGIMNTVVILTAFLIVLGLLRDIIICILKGKDPHDTLIFSLFDFLCIRLSYKNSSYSRDTGKTFNETFGDKGSYGEYLTYHRLRKYEKNGGKFLFNAYIPRKDGGTTEIDLMLICSEGIFVFESKNYSGWIFGSEDRQMWYVTLPAGKKRSRCETFYNPIRQNRAHINNLKEIIGDGTNIFSVIVFSERCTLKKIDAGSIDAAIIKRNEIFQTVKRIRSESNSSYLSSDEIDSLYKQLYKYTLADDETKAQHIENIAHNYSSYRKKNTNAVTLNSSPDIQGLKDSADSEIHNETSNSTYEYCIATPECAHETLSEEPRICPRCGHKLVLRHTSRGAHAGSSFYGCSGYPKCRYTESITTDIKT